ncbi:MAG: hypothetical protein IJ220_04995 [Clostridia bacterium]|nr:hypothetical protein [Clostridia bacterium]
MDNASKALIMAGGFLIGVMIISVSMYILATARGMAKDSNEQIERSAAESFNRYYQSFDSTISGIDALNIYNKVQDDNWRYDVQRTSDHYIAIQGDTSFINSLLEPDGVSRMSEEHSYLCQDSDQDGYIDTVIIY